MLEAAVNVLPADAQEIDKLGSSNNRSKKLMRAPSNLFRSMRLKSRPGLDRTSSNCSSTETNKRKKVKINIRKNRIHNIPTRGDIEDPCAVWYNPCELKKMAESVGNLVVFSAPIKQYTRDTATFYQSVLDTSKKSKTTVTTSPLHETTTKIPSLVMNGIMHGFRGLELHGEEASRRHTVATNSVHKLVKAQRKAQRKLPKRQGPDEDSQSDLAKYYVKLCRSSVTWALLVAQADAEVVRLERERNGSSQQEGPHRDDSTDLLDEDDSKLLHFYR